jgi:hypothetical protein
MSGKKVHMSREAMDLIEQKENFDKDKTYYVEYICGSKNWTMSVKADHMKIQNGSVIIDGSMLVSCPDCISILKSKGY